MTQKCCKSAIVNLSCLDFRGQSHGSVVSPAYRCRHYISFLSLELFPLSDIIDSETYFLVSCVSLMVSHEDRPQ